MPIAHYICLKCKQTFQQIPFFPTVKNQNILEISKYLLFKRLSQFHFVPFIANGEKLNFDDFDQIYGGPHHAFKNPYYVFEKTRLELNWGTVLSTCI